MRTIKFRGQRVNNGEWLIGNLVIIRNAETDSNYPSIVISYNDDTFDWEDVIPETVGQFTGFLDKNGVEVYSGDKVKNGLSGIWEIKPCIGGFELFCLEGWHKGSTFDFSALNSDAEVIGNIYQDK